MHPAERSVCKEEKKNRSCESIKFQSQSKGGAWTMKQWESALHEPLCSSTFFGEEPITQRCSFTRRDIKLFVVAFIFISFHHVCSAFKMPKPNLAGTLCTVCNNYQSCTHGTIRAREMPEHTPTVVWFRISMFHEVMSLITPTCMNTNSKSFIIWSWSTCVVFLLVDQFTFMNALLCSHVCFISCISMHFYIAHINLTHGSVQ